MLDKPIQAYQPATIKELMGFVEEIRKRAAEEHRKEMERIRNKEPSGYKYTKYVYDLSLIPPSYVRLDKIMRTTEQVRKYARQIRRNTGGTLIVMPSITKPFKTEFPRYEIFSPIPEAALSLVMPKPPTNPSRS